MATSTSTSSTTTTTSAMNPRTALASAAGTTQPQKHRPTSLRTPLTGTYPSTIHSPSTSFSSFHNIPPTPVSSTSDHAHAHHHHQSTSDIPPASATSFTSRTPLTPPPAYLDFLKAVSPSILPSPLSTGTSVHFSFSATPTAKSPGLPVPHSAALSGRWTGREKWPAHATRHVRASSASQRPVLSSHVSEESTVSTISSLSSAESMESLESDVSTNSVPAGSVGTSERPAGPSGIAAPQARSSSDSQVPTTTSTFAAPNAKPSSTTAMARPTSTRPPRPLRRPSIIIPPSPSTSVPIPVSASDVHSASSSSFRNSAMSSASTATPGWHTATSPARTPTKTPKTVSVRQVVTKTVTYNRPQSNSVTYSSTGARVLREADRGGAAGVVKQLDVGEEDIRVKVEDGRRDDEDRVVRHSTPKPLVGEAPKGKRRKVD